MKSILKKNQIMITALAIMIAVAGYLNFAGTNLEDEEYVSTSAESVNDVTSEGITTENIADTDLTLDGLLDISDEDLQTADTTDIASLDSDDSTLAANYSEEQMQTAAVGETATATLGETPTDGEIPGEAVFTNTNNVAALADAKLMKEQTRAKNKEALLQIINSTTLSDEQKQSAVDSMIKMTGVAEKETAAEILLEAKGFQDVVVSISETGVDVVVNSVELNDAQRAQIEDIVKRKTEVSAENIIISTVVE